MPPQVSIVVTCYNQAHCLDQAVASVLNQSFADLECLILDDGSTDSTREVAQAWVAADSRVQYFYKENGGVSSARNLGAQKAQGEWVQFLDGDDWIHEDKIRFQLSHLDALDHPEDIVFYSDYERVFLDESHSIIWRESKTVGPLSCDRILHRLLIPDFLADTPFPTLQQCLLMHRSVFEKKRFDEALRALQDRDFAIDLLLLGVRFVYTPITGAYYTKHGSNRTNAWSYMKDYYLLLYETVYRKHPQVLKSSQRGVEYLLEEAIRERDTDHLHRLLKITQCPVKLFQPGITFYHARLIRLFFYIKPLIPNQLLYPKCRGPRSERALQTMAKLLSLGNLSEAS
ncbi:MAG: glycosyltransferase family 2 protein [Cyanobacteria bacterium Co-bin13]|nr:glycosyltransferase family 2 protein [Cyanobacteria bacterium Co-bin13]